MYYYLIITSLLRHYYVIIISLLQNGNHVIMMALLHQLTCYANGMTPLLCHYYTLLRHYADLCCYPLLPISVSQTCTWPLGPSP